MESNKNKVAVIVPHVRFPLTEDEELSLRHLRHYLGRFDRYVIGPARREPGLGDLELVPFPAKYFSSITGYSRLLTEKRFYEAFRDYQYILIYQLDCLVFSSDLDQWCNRQWDYVGAPWMAAAPWVEGNDHNDAKGFWWVGNGGLSLRRVDAALNVLNSRQLCVDPNFLGMSGRFKDAPFFIGKGVQYIKTKLYATGYRNSLRFLLKKMSRSERFNEDLFWAFHAKHFLPEFSIPSPEDAVFFSFECAPRYCFKVTEGRLPFGCHAWNKYDRAFWEPYLLK